MPEMTIQQKREWFRRTATDPRARAEFAASRADVILPLLDEQSTVRAIFQVENLGPGAQARYDIPFEDIDCVFLMPQIGGVPFVQLEGAEMFVDTHGLDGGVEYQEDVAEDGRFQVAQRATELLKNKFIAQEEAAGWALIKAHAATLDTTQQINGYAADGTEKGDGTGLLNIYTLNEAITTADEIGVGGRRVTDIFVSPRRYGDLRNQVTMTALPEAMRQAIWNGGQGRSSEAEIRVHKVYNSDLVGDTRGYAFTQKQGFTYGVMPIRTPLRTRDNPIAQLEHKIGIHGRERLGFAVLDSLGLIEIIF